MYRNRAASPLLVGFLLAACGSPTGPAGGVEPITQLPRALSGVEEELIAASNDFGLELTREVVAEADGPNVVLSPLSASMALGMTLNGASGSTFDAMRSTLGYGDLSRGEINAAYRDLLALLRDLDGSVEFSVANSIWAREDFPFREAFFDDVTAAFDATVENRDFGVPATLEAINDWVSRETEGYIPRLLDEIDPAMVMLLVNAIYFDGRWTTAFDPDETEPADFRLADGTTVPVEMMSMEDPTASARVTEDYTAVELPYGGGAFGMVVVVPRDGRTARELVAEMDGAWWEDLSGGLQETDLGRIALPRFTLSWGGQLNAALERMGMDVAFDPVAAEFLELSPLGDDLYIDQVRQKTFIQVDEAGTTAAAATSVGIVPTSLPPSLVADRPFLFALRERLSGTLIFTGLVGDPTVEE